MKISTNQKSDLENFHRRKVLTKECLQNKIRKQIQVVTDVPPVLVPSGLQTSNVLYVPKTLKCSVYSTSSTTQENYIAHYGAGPENWVNIWSKDATNELKITKQKKKLDCRILNIVFICNGYIYLAFCDDLTLRVFSNDFREHSCLPLTYSLLSMMYDENKNKIITGCVGFVQQWTLPSCLHKPPVFESETKLHDHVTGVTPWISFLHFDKENDSYLALTGTGIFIVDAITLEQINFIENRHRFPLTTCLAYAPRHYLITGAKNGDIKAWNMSMHSFPYVGSFNGHMKRIINILSHPAEPLLITSSEDSTIRFWRIETFHETYRFDVLDTILDVFIVNARKFYYSSPKSLCLLDFNYFHSIFALIGTKITAMHRISPMKKPSRILIVGDDGGVRVVSPTHGNILTMVFPIITHKSVAHIHDSVEERIYILLKNGGVMVTSTKSNPCRTLELWRAPRLDDRLLCLGLTFIRVAGETRSLLFGTHFDGRMSLLRGIGLTMKTMVQSRGVITRFVQNVADDPPCHFLTLNTENAITLWKIELVSDNSFILVALDDIHLDGPPSHLALRNDYVGVASGKTFMSVYFVPQKRGQCMLRFYNHGKDERHRALISEAKGCSHLPIFATASLDGRVKIWSTECSLLRELSFDETLSGLAFANARGDLLVGFQGNLHLVLVTEFLPSSYLEVLLEDDYEDDETEYCISFDPLLRFWYDKKWVSNISIWNAYKDIMIDDIQEPIEEEESTESLNLIQKDEIFENRTHPFLFEGEIIDFYKAALMLTRTYENTDSKNRWRNLKPLTLRSWVNSSKSSPKHRRRRTTIAPCGLIEFSELSPFETLASEIIEMIRNSPSKESLLKIFDSFNNIESPASEKSGVEAEDTRSCTNSKKYWPCAPDGFIPNSVIRYLIEPEPPKQPPDKQSFRPRRFSKIAKEQPIFHNLDEDYDEIRQWCSDDGEDDDGDSDADEQMTNNKYDPWKAPTDDNLKQKETNKKQPSKNEKTVRPHRPISKLTPAKKLRFKPQNKVDEMNENTEEERFEESPKVEIKSSQVKPPPPFDKYYEKKWFPKNIRFSVSDIVKSLLPLLDPSDPFTMKEILDLLVDIHKLHEIPTEYYDQLVQILLQYLSHSSGQVRHYAVKALIGLGENRNSVLLNLVSKLNDPVLAVREAVKKALKLIAGIDNGDNLAARLKQMGQLKESPVLANDIDVLEDFRDILVTRRKSFLDRMEKIKGRETWNISIFNSLVKSSVEKRRKKERGIKLKNNNNNSKWNKFVDEERVKMKVLEDWASLMQKNNKSDEFLSSSSSSTEECASPEDLESLTSYNVKNQQKMVAANKAGKMAVGKHAVKNKSVISSTQQMLSKKTPQTNLSRSDSDHSKKSVSTMVYDGATMSKQRLEMIPDRHDRKGLYTNNHLVLLLNRSIVERGKGNISVIKSMAPNVYKKFRSLQPDCELLQQLDPALQSMGDPYDSESKEKEEQKIQAGKKLQMKLKKLTEMTKDDEQSIEDNEVDDPRMHQREMKECEATIRFVQKALLVTAVSALRAKRKNQHDVPNHNIIGNETLKDICLLMKCFEHKDKFNLKTLGVVMEAVHELQSEIDDVVTPVHTQHGNIPIQKSTHIDFVPSLIQRTMVPGVCGERIFSKLRVSDISRKQITHRNHIMKPIPERNGHFTVETMKNKFHKFRDFVLVICLTVTELKGCTNYGPMEFHWTTFSSAYDMNLVAEEEEGVQNGRRRRRGGYLPCIRKTNCMLQPDHQINSNQQNTGLLLPKIQTTRTHCERVDLHSANLYAPAPPNTALAFSR